MTDTKAEVVAQMNVYFDGLYHSDSNMLRRVFHSDARYVCATGDEVINIGMGEYFPIVDNREAPAARNEVRQDRIVSIILGGTDAAFVHAHCAIGERFFTDFLTFIRTPDGWRIISKVFHYEIKPING